MTFPTITLPSRALALARGVLSIPRIHFLTAPIMLFVAVFLVVMQGPGILQDYKISQNPLTIDGDIDGECQTRKAVVTSCEATLTYDYDGGRYEKNIDVMFVDMHSGDYETDLVISADQPELATISLALDKLWSRIFIFAAFTVAFTGLFLAPIFQAIRVLRARGQFARPARLTPVPVEITAMENKGRRLSATYADTLSERKTGRTAHTRFARGEEPLIVGRTGGNAVALAVWHGDAALPVLLDSRLMRIDMTAKERADALAPLEAAMPAAEDRQAPPVPEVAKAGPSLARRIGLALLIGLLVVAAYFGYWLWYVTSASSAFTAPAMDINAAMPESLNRWGCEQLKKRFGDDRAPYGCVAADYQSWK